MAKRNAIVPPSDDMEQTTAGKVDERLLNREENESLELDEAFSPPSPVPQRQTPPPPPNPLLIKSDPMAEVFGPGSNVRMLGNPEEDEIPDAIRGLIEDHGLSKKDFSCTLKEIPEGVTMDNLDCSSNSVYVHSWKRSIPSEQYIAREHGPGSYIIVLTWTSFNHEENIHKRRREIVPITISDKCAAEYKKRQLDKKINEAAATGAKVRDVLVEKTIEGQLVSAITGKDVKDELKQTPKEYLNDLMSTVRDLGLPVGFGNQTPVKGIEWDKILPAVVPLVTAFLTMQQTAEQRRVEESNKMFMLLLSQNQNSSSQLMEMLKFQAMKPAGENPLKEMQTMIMNALDIKNLLNPPQETLSDKIFHVVELVVPQILTIAATAAQNKQPPRGAAVDMAKMFVANNPDFEKLKNDPVEMIKFINKLDDRIGWENADMLCNIMEWERPVSCSKDPGKRFAPQEPVENCAIEEGDQQA